MKKACLTPSEKGVCEPCEFDRYTEHDNGLQKCLLCTKCRIGNSVILERLILSHTVKSLFCANSCNRKPLRLCKPNQYCVHTMFDFY